MVVMNKLFIGGLSFDTTDEGLKEYYSQWGTITDSVVMKDQHSGRSRGFGFVTYSTNEELDAAQLARPHLLDGRKLEPKRAIPKQMRDSMGMGNDFKNVNKIYCGGITDDIQKEDLEEFFSTFGEVTEVMMINKKGSSERRGFAFVTFKDYDVVDKITYIKKHSLKGCDLEACKAFPKNEDDNRRGGGRDNFAGGRDNFRGRDNFGGRDSFGGRGPPHGDTRRGPFSDSRSRNGGGGGGRPRGYDQPSRMDSRSSHREQRGDMRREQEPRRSMREDPYQSEYKSKRGAARENNNKICLIGDSLRTEIRKMKLEAEKELSRSNKDKLHSNLGRHADRSRGYEDRESRDHYSDQPSRHSRAPEIDRYGRPVANYGHGEDAAVDPWSANGGQPSSAEYDRRSSRAYPTEEVREPLKTKEEYLRLAELASRRDESMSRGGGGHGGHGGHRSNGSSYALDSGYPSSRGQDYYSSAREDDEMVSGHAHTGHLDYSRHDGHRYSGGAGAGGSSSINDSQLREPSSRGYTEHMGAYSQHESIGAVRSGYQESSRRSNPYGR